MPQAVSKADGSGSSAPTCSCTPDAMHILFNMLGVWMFGVELERVWGTRLFARYYAITGVGAGIVRGRRVVAADRRAAASYSCGDHRRVGCALRPADGFRAALARTSDPAVPAFPIPAKYFVMIYGALALLSVPGTQVSSAGAPRRTARSAMSTCKQRPRRRHHRRNQVSLSQMEDEPAAPQVRRLLGRQIGLGQARSLGRLKNARAVATSSTFFHLPSTISFHSRRSR